MHTEIFDVLPFLAPCTAWAAGRVGCELRSNVDLELARTFHIKRFAHLEPGPRPCWPNLSGGVVTVLVWRGCRKLIICFPGRLEPSLAQYATCKFGSLD